MPSVERYNGVSEIKFFVISLGTFSDVLPQAVTYYSS